MARPIRTCKVKGCNEKYKASGLCNKHYLQRVRGVELDMEEEVEEAPEEVEEVEEAPLPVSTTPALPTDSRSVRDVVLDGLEDYTRKLFSVSTTADMPLKAKYVADAMKAWLDLPDTKVGEAAMEENRRLDDFLLKQAEEMDAKDSDV